MKPEDFPIVVINGYACRRVPELRPSEPDDNCRCDMCAVSIKGGDCSEANESACAQLDTEDHCGDDDTIYLPEENFTEYLVEVVRRRIS